jgi:hypothetical protein
VQSPVAEANERAGGQAGHAQAAAEMAIVHVGEGFLQVFFEHRGWEFLTAKDAESTEENV